MPLRVSTLPATTSRRGTEQPQRARIPTSSSSSKSVFFFSNLYCPSDACRQLYRFLARRTDSDFNKVPICAVSLNTVNQNLIGYPPPPLPLKNQPSTSVAFSHHER